MNLTVRKVVAIFNSNVCHLYANTLPRNKRGRRGVTGAYYEWKSFTR